MAGRLRSLGPVTTPTCCCGQRMAVPTGTRCRCPDRLIRRRKRGGSLDAMATAPSRQFLLIDGDDTLWENNVYFEQAIEAFIDFLAHSSMSRDQVRAALDEIERMNVRVHGYGSASFTNKLRQTYERLADRALQPEDIEHVVQLGERIATQPMQL